MQIALVVEDRSRDTTGDSAFHEAVASALVNERGWSRAGFRFSFVTDATYRVVLAEPPEVDRLCAPYRTAGRWSCQLGPLVVVNADRWRTATPSWPTDLQQYRVMLVNHEVGHLLGQHHPQEPCSATGELAAVMAQQSKGLHGCVPNSWPLDWEVECAKRHDEPLAPGYEATATPTCGP